MMNKNLNALAIQGANKLNSMSGKVKGLMVAAYIAVMTAAPALATTNTIVDGVSKGFNSLWNILVGVAFPVAAIALAVCAIKMLWGGQKAAEEAKSTAIRIIVGICIVLMAPGIIATVKSWFTQSSWSFG